ISESSEQPLLNIVEQALIRPPFSRIGPIESKERKRIIKSSLVYGFYEKTVDRESAYEMLKKRAKQAPKETPKAKKKRGRPRQGIVETMAKSAARTVGRQIGNKLIRGILGSILK
ncbi:helicase HerA-like domain-containing protein, partial [Ruegeria sp.]|uniref:helicase HerA-like domain-containing protein n=1 Tax=Ruegeria sp. TaxID=1879320 RepID=UPI00231245AE